MSKEIYKKYLCEWVDAENLDEMAEVNRAYLYDGVSLFNKLTGEDKQSHYMAVINDVYELFTRKPKTQMINGHEVVAPRYDEPEHRMDIIVMNCFSENGIEIINFSAKTMKAVTIWGWFSTDNEDDAIAYANAHRENKQ